VSHLALLTCGDRQARPIDAEERRSPLLRLLTLFAILAGEAFSSARFLLG
jgi:hypothetical protein